MMKKFFSKISISFLLLILTLNTFLLFNLFFHFSLAVGEKGSVCLVYFTGVGCPHCARTDPVILNSLLKKYPNLIIIEYEVYQEEKNASLIYDYNQKYQTGLGIPLIVFDESKYLIGDKPILNNLENYLGNLNSNSCLLLSGKKNFSELDLNSLPRFPKIWRGQRILIKLKDNSGTENQVLKDLVLKNDLRESLTGINFEKVEPKEVLLSGRKKNFEKAIRLDGWLFQWNGQEIKISNQIKESPSPTPVSTPQPALTSTPKSSPFQIQDNLGNKNQQRSTLTIGKVFSLALVDSINPCALAVLVLVLISVLTFNPGDRKKIFLTGFSFLLSVFLIYFFYGLIIIRFFQVSQTISFLRIYLYKILAVFAIILGILHLKDFFHYQPAGFLTEMPLSFRPKVKEFLSRVSSPKSAFLAGAFVSLFLLPCTIGPYIICGGILCSFGLLKSIPYLLFYNLVFILPMLIIVLLVCFGLAEATKIAQKKDRNIRYIHLLAGLIIFLLGILMLFGFI